MGACRPLTVGLARAQIYLSWSYRSGSVVQVDLSLDVVVLKHMIRVLVSTRI